MINVGFIVRPENGSIDDSNGYEQGEFVDVVMILTKFENGCVLNLCVIFDYVSSICLGFWSFALQILMQRTLLWVKESLCMISVGTRICQLQVLMLAF